MPSTPRAKSPKHQRALIDAATGVDGTVLLIEMVVMYQQAEGDTKFQYAKELLPYLKPKLKAIELQGNLVHDVKVTLGGD